VVIRFSKAQAIVADVSLSFSRASGTLFGVSLSWQEVRNHGLAL